MPEKIRFFPIDTTYKVINSKPVIHLFGRTADGKQILVLDENFEPYFYAIPKKASVKEKLEKIKVEKKKDEIAEVTKVDLVDKKFHGKKVEALKVYTKLPSDVPVIRDAVRDWEILEAVTEYDIPFSRRYLIDKNIVPMILTEAEGEFTALKARVPVLNAKKVEQSSDETLTEPKILAFDIETYNPEGENIDAEKNPIIMLSFYGNRFKKAITWKKFRTAEDVEFVDSEAALIERFKETVEKYKPDILTGYYSDGFDLPYIEARARKYRIKLDLGMDFSTLKVDRRAAATTCKIFGIAHVDIFKFIARTAGSQLDTELYGLNDVAGELLGEKKAEVELAELAGLWDKAGSRLDEFIKYNLHDAYLTYRLTEKLLPNLIEMVKIIGLPLYSINRMGFSQLVEWYLLKNEGEFGEIAPESPYHDEIRKRRMQTYRGGFVYEPKPGLYKDIVVFDFRSLYPSIISSHNISPATLNCECCEENAETAPTEDKKEKYWFCKKKKGFIPTMMEDLVKRRMRIKEIIEEDSSKKEASKNPLLEARLQSLKLLANSFYGYLGFFGARWYSLECVKAITAYGRHYIHKVIDEAGKAGFTVIYSDTDSLFVLLDKKTKKDADKFLEEINVSLPGVMELEYEGFYPIGIFVSAKAGPYGAKKKYALLSEDKSLKIRGFETVRRNWSTIAKEVQQNVLNIILKENNNDKALKYIKDTVNELKKKTVPNEKLIIHTQLRKDISGYDSVGPHVAVASKMRDRGIAVGPGTMITYIVTPGKEKIRDRAKIPSEVKEGKYDSAYYISNQVIPAVESIFNLLGYSKEELAEGEGQKKLGRFFK